MVIYTGPTGGTAPVVDHIIFSGRLDGSTPLPTRTRDSGDGSRVPLSGGQKV